MFQLKILKRTNLLFVITIFILSVIGSLNVLATTYFPEKQLSQLFYNQLGFYVLGFLLFAILSALNIKSLNRPWVQSLIYMSALTLLLLVIFKGEEIYGARRWIRIGVFTLQPSEFTKITIILISAYFLDRWKNVNLLNSQTLAQKESKLEVFQNDFKSLINNFLVIRFKKLSLKIYYPKLKLKAKRLQITIESSYIILPIVTFTKYLIQIILSLILIGLIFVQNSLGNTILNLLILLTLNLLFLDFDRKLLMYLLLIPIGIVASVLIDIRIISIVLPIIIFALMLARFKFKFNIIIALMIVICSMLVIPAAKYSYDNLLEDYQRQRIDTYLNPDKYDFNGARWNVEQSKNAIGSAGFTGKGFLKGTQSNYQLLPFSFTDFAYAAYVEQFGTIGVLILFVLHIILILQILGAADNTNNTFKQLIVFGVAIMIFLNTAQHIAMNLGYVPVTGVPLPLISYGGSSVLVIFLGLGLVSSIMNSKSGQGVRVIRE